MCNVMKPYNLPKKLDVIYNKFLLRLFMFGCGMKILLKIAALTNTLTHV